MTRQVPGQGAARWAELSSPELGARAARDSSVVVLPIGAVEQHGAHLPVDVDIHIAESIATRVAEQDPDVIVGPSLPFGISANHTGFPGTISLRSQTMLALLEDVFDSVTRAGFRRILVLNGHNGNAAIGGQATIDAGLRTGAHIYHITYFDLVIETYNERRRSPVGGSGHACEFETSIELALRPDLVGDDRAKQMIGTAGVPGTFRDITRRGFVARGAPFEKRYPHGVMGDPTVATAELGQILLDGAVTGISELVGAIRDLPAPRLRHESVQNDHEGLTS